MYKDKSEKRMYEELCSYENLEIAFNKARKGKTQKKYVIEFEENLKTNLLQLRKELIMQTYKPEQLKTFILRDPKTRKISKSAFRDRIVHHAICNIIEPSFEKLFIYDSYANRIGKGTLNAVKRFNIFKRKASNNNTIRCFVLKADIRSYFDTIDHEILMGLLSKRIQDKRILMLIKIIISNYQVKECSKGMPLGNLTSQFFANVYLNELDQFVKHKLKAKYYIRYVDDFVILDKSKPILEKYKKNIIDFLMKTSKLELHPDKSQILKLEKGINFLGFRIFYNHILLNKKNIKKFERKLQERRDDYHDNKLCREKIIEKYEGWIAYARQANTYKYRKRIMKKFNMIFPAKKETSIVSVKKHENFNDKIDLSQLDFSSQKTLHLIKKGKTIKQIADARQLKESTVWNHITKLIEWHQIRLKDIIENHKIKKILNKINSYDEKLKVIKDRINDESITYAEINCVLANLRGKHKEKSLVYFVNWYKKTNCHRKCYFNKKQRDECRGKFQHFIELNPSLKFIKKDFLSFFNEHINICQLPEKEKKKFVNYREFLKNKREKITKR